VLNYFVLSTLILFGLLVFPQSVVFDTIPLNYQLFPRDTHDSAAVSVTGSVVLDGKDSITIEMYKNGLLWKRNSDNLVYNNGTALFKLYPKLHAELAEYSIKLLLDEDSIIQIDSIVCGDAYLINGQSNAAANDYDDSVHYRCEWVRSTRRLNNVGWGLARADTIYADYTVGVWGLRLGKLISDSNGIPVAIINGALGSTDIEDHLRYEPNPTNTYHLYGHLLTRAINAGIRDKVRALFWHQGENNSLDLSYLNYAHNFDTLYHAWKEDYPGLEKIYVFQGHPGCGGSYQHQIREMQRKFPETYPDIHVMSTVGLGYHDGCHYHYPGYNNMAQRMYDMIKWELYGSHDTAGSFPPNIRQAYYTSSTRDEVCLVFDQPVLWPSDTFITWNTTTTYYSMQDYFYLADASPDGINHEVDSGYAIPVENKVILRLTQTSPANHITYLPNSSYSLGPWLRNERGVGALTFFEFPLDSEQVTTIGSIQTDRTQNSKIQVWPNPFNPMVRITVSGGWKTDEQRRKMALKIYNVSGKLVMDLSAQPASLSSGISWNAAAFPSGIYIVRLIREDDILERTIMLLR